MKIFISIILIFLAKEVFSQYGLRPYEDVVKLKDYTLIVPHNFFGEEHYAEARTAIEKYWKFSKVKFPEKNSEYVELRKDPSTFSIGILDDLDPFAFWFFISDQNSGMGKGYACFPVGHHYYPPKKEKNVSAEDVYISFLPLALKVMQNYLHLVEDKKITGEKFKDIQASCERYYNSLSPLIKERQLNLTPIHSITANTSEVPAYVDKIKEMYPYKLKVATYEDLLNAASGGYDDKASNDLIVYHAGHYLTVVDPKDGTVYYSRDNAPLAYLNVPVMKFLVEAIDGKLEQKK